MNFFNLWGNRKSLYDYSIVDMNWDLWGLPGAVQGIAVDQILKVTNYTRLQLNWNVYKQVEYLQNCIWSSNGGAACNKTYLDRTRENTQGFTFDPRSHDRNADPLF